MFELLPSGNAIRLVGATGLDLAAIGSVERRPADHPLARGSLGVDEPLINSDWRPNALQVAAPLPEAGVTS